MARVRLCFRRRMRLRSGAPSRQAAPDTGFGIRFVDSPRHRFEAEPAGFRELRRLERVLR